MATLKSTRGLAHLAKMELKRKKRIEKRFPVPVQPVKSNKNDSKS